MKDGGGIPEGEGGMKMSGFIHKSCGGYLIYIGKGNRRVCEKCGRVVYVQDNTKNSRDNALAALCEGGGDG